MIALNRIRFEHQIGRRCRVMMNEYYRINPQSQQQSLLRISITTSSSSNPQIRCFSFSSIFDTKYTNHDHRHEGIETHPQSISHQIQPGNFILRPGPTAKKRYTEFVYGYFWMLKDLTKSKEKPILSNVDLIPETKAKALPRLSNIQSLTGQVVNLPEYIWRKNRTMDAHAQCTVVAVSFRDFGYRLLSNWLTPFQEAFENNNKKDRVAVIRLNISEGWFHKYILKGFIMGLTKTNTPVQEHEQTFLYFGNHPELELFRDSLRMHNALTGYVFLLDGLGRVRFAGCGPASEGEIERLVQMANELIAPSYDWSARKNTNHVHKRIKRSFR